MATPNKIGAQLATLGLLTDVDTTKRNFLGARVQDDQGGEYVYLQGIASLAAGDFIVYGNAAAPYVVTRLVNDANSGGAGSVALAMAAALATQFGWFQVYGPSQANANVATTASIGVQLYRSGTTGRAAVTAVAKDCLFGVYTMAASVANVGQVFLDYPTVTDQSTL